MVALLAYHTTNTESVFKSLPNVLSDDLGLLKLYCMEFYTDWILITSDKECSHSTWIWYTKYNSHLIYLHYV